MRFFLSDFIRLGAVFEPLQVLSANPKKLELIGDLVYYEKRVHVKIRVSRRGVSRVISVVDNEKKNALENFKWLHDFRKNALRKNVNGLREIVRSRTISFCIWYFCFVLHILTMLCVISSFVNSNKILFSIFFFVVVLFSFFKLCRNKWRLIPHASNHYGEHYGY